MLEHESASEWVKKLVKDFMNFAKPSLWFIHLTPNSYISIVITKSVSMHTSKIMYPLSSPGSHRINHGLSQCVLLKERKSFLAQLQCQVVSRLACYLLLRMIGHTCCSMSPPLVGAEG